MKLEIITPNQIYFSGEVSSVTLPGELGLFSIWRDHAPLISILKAGKLTYVTAGKQIELKINGGFMDVNKNVISVCLETI